MTKDELGIELTAFASEAAGRARVAIVGSSMRPLLRAGMIADIEPLRRRPRTGDILVFRSFRGLIVHRVVRRLGATGYRTCGDACPEAPEEIGDPQIVGRVRRVWSSAQRGARRIDGPLFALAGALLARTRTPRATARLARNGLRFLVRAPQVVPAFRTLFAAAVAFERGAAELGVARAQAVPSAAFLAAAKRHGMCGFFQRRLAAAAAAGLPVAPELLAELQRVRWHAALSTTQVRARACEVARLLAAAGIDAVFLKGAARLLAQRAGADLHASGDVDVLVPRARVEEAVAALRAAGYRERTSVADIRYHARRIQHRAPLWPPRGNVPVEVHVALAMPGSVSAALDYETLAPHVRSVVLSEGETAAVFDDVAAALHLAYHARDFHILRDIALLASYLRGMTPSERDAFDRLVRSERRDALRLSSAVAAADLFNTGHRPSGRAVSYLDWVCVREDLPPALRKRAAVLEALRGRCLPHYRGAAYTLGQLHRWAYNAAALPVLFRWMQAYSKATEAGSELMCSDAVAPTPAPSVRIRRVSP